jgi:hypothetical protein
MSRVPSSNGIGRGKANAAASCLSTVLLASCATSLPMTQPSIEVTHVYEKNFSLNMEQSAAVGQDMLRVKDYCLDKTTENAWEAKEPFEVAALITTLKFHAGIFPIDGRKEVGGQVYDLVHLTPYNGGTLPFLVDSDGHIAKVMNAVELAADDVRILPANFKMSKALKTKVDSSQGYTNFELIYTGQSNGTLHISYREYSPDDLARTAFFQELNYSSGQRAIRFRDIGIQVTSATNEQIVFKVVEFPEVSQGVC